MFSFVIDNPEIKRRRIERRLPLEKVSVHETESLECIGKEPWQPFQEVQVKTDEPDSDSDNSSESDAALFWSEEVSPSQYQSKQVTRDWSAALAEMQAPQRSELWLQARKNCITASQFGSAIGLNPQSSPEQMLVEKIWIPFRGNEATHWGTYHEPDAGHTFQTWFRETQPAEKDTEYVFKEYGLLKSDECPWMAVSPDGILQVVNHAAKLIEWQVLEQKCPWFKRDSTVHPQNKQPDNVPTQYRAQVVGVSGYLSDTQVHYKLDQASQVWPKDYTFTQPCKGAFFVVWTPNRTWITEMPFEKDKWILWKSQLKDFQFSKMLPALTHFFNGRLQENSLQARQTIQQT